MGRAGMIILAVVIALFGIRLLSSGLRTLVIFFTPQEISPKAKQTLYRDLIMGVLLIILSFVMFI